MFRIIVIVLVSVVASALTTVGIMVRYANLSVQDILPKEVSLKQETRFQQAQDVTLKMENFEYSPQKKNEILELQPISQPKSDELLEEPADLQQTKPLYFDHKKLNEDMAKISAVLERFNGMVQQEIQNYKGANLTNKN